MNINSSMGTSPFFQQTMRPQVEKVDSDGNGSLSFDEISTKAPEGIDKDKLEKFLSKIDSNGDGEISTEERQVIKDKMQERMESFSGGMNLSSLVNNEENTYDMLLDSLSNNSKEDSSYKSGSFVNMTA